VHAQILMFVCRFAAFGQMSPTTSEESHIWRYVFFVFSVA